jgi:hypothetical protein
MIRIPEPAFPYYYCFTSKNNMNFEKRIILLFGLILILTTIFYTPYKVSKYKILEPEFDISSAQWNSYLYGKWGEGNAEAGKILQYQNKNDTLLNAEWIEFHSIITPPLSKARSKGYLVKKEVNYFIQGSLIIGELITIVFLSIIFKSSRKDKKNI